MDMNLDSMSSQLLYTTTRIVAVSATGTTSVGTGFFFHFKIDSQTNVPVIITNKHVVQGMTTASLRLHKATTDPDGKMRPSGESVTITIQSLENSWIGHSGDVDICAIPIANIFEFGKNNGYDLFHIKFDESLIPSDEALAEMSAMEDVVMVGYPVGLWDSVNNYPLLRRGVTSSHPYIDFNGESLGAVDIAAFPGSSGSPIVLLNQGSYATRTGITIGNRLHLLGILASGPQFTAEGQLRIVDIPTASTPVISTSIPIHLGYYIKAKELLVLRADIASTISKQPNIGEATDMP